MKCARKEILLPTVMYNKGFQKEFEYDATLPEFLPNINRPVKVDARIIVDSLTPGEDKIEMTGKVVYGFLYVSDYQDTLKYAEFMDDFSLVLDVPGVRPDSVITPTIECTGISCKMINPRKFLLKSQFDFAFTVNNNNKYEILDENSDDCFFKTDTVTCFTVVPTIQRDFNFTDSYDIGDSFSPISEIVTKSIFITPAEHSCGDGYINIKAGANVKMMCLESGENPQIFVANRTIPISMIIEDDEIGSDSVCIVTLEPVSLDTEVGIDSYGENRVIESKLTVKANVRCYKPQIITLATDVFAANTTNVQTPVELKFNKFIDIEKKVFTIEKIVETDDMEFSKIYDTTAVLAMEKSELTATETICSGSATVTLLGETTGGIDLLDLPVDFTEKLPATDISEINVRPVEVVAATVGNSNISLKIIAVAEYIRSEDDAVTAIEDCEFTDMPEQESSPSLLIYYPAENDDLWSIAKQYGIAPTTLKESNNERFDGDKPVSTVIVIPKASV